MSKAQREQLERIYLDQRRRLAEIEADVQAVKRKEGDLLAERHEALKGVIQTERLLESFGVDAGVVWQAAQGGKGIE